MYQVNIIYWPLLLIVDLIGYLLISPFVRLRKKPTEIKKVLIIRIEEIGDVILTTPFVRELKNNFKRAEIHVLCKNSTKELFESNTYINKIHICEKSWLDSSLNFNYFISLIKFLKKEKYDLAFDLHPDPRNIILAFSVSKYALGFSYRGLGFLLYRSLQFKNAHIIEQNLNLLRKLKLNITSSELQFYYSKKDEQTINQFLNKNKIKNFIVMHPGTRRSEKKWSTSKWIELCKDFIGKDYKILLTGSKDERDYNKSIVEIVNKKKAIINVAGKTSLSQLGILIKNSLLFIGPDTGALHIARAVETPLIGLFASENPNIWGYTNEKYQSIYKKNMKEIEVKEVIDKANEIL